MELFNKIIKVVVSLQAVVLLFIIMGWFGTETAMTAMEMGAWDAYNYVQKLLNDYGENPSMLVSEIPPSVHTIGNTLPIDIVEAIQEFSSSDPDFFPEPDGEFQTN